jgi:hypothetical protein
MPFPDFKTQAPEPRTTDLAAIRSVFKNSNKISIKRDRLGVVELTFGNVTTSVLQTRINSVALEPLARYNPTMALDAIGETEEVKAAMRKAKLEFPLAVTDMFVVTPEKGRPHLPAKLDDITVEQVLDLIAKTFKGISTYGVCEGEGNRRLLSMDFLFLENRVKGNSQH